MKKLSFVSTPIMYYFLRFLTVYLAFYVQVFFFNPLLKSIGVIDFVSLVVFVVFFEKREVFSFFLLLWAAFLLASASSAPTEFFIMYYLCSYVFICFLYRFFLFENYIEKVIVTFFLLLFKYICIYLNISMYYNNNLISYFLKDCYLSVFFTLLTMVFFLFLYKKYEFLIKRKTW